jgi:hypothetical protein
MRRLVSVVVLLLLTACREERDDSRQRQATDGGTALEHSSIFVPKVETRAGRTTFRLVFADGRRLVASYPSSLEVAEFGAQPDVSYLYRRARAERFPLTFVHGPAPPRSGEISLRAGSWTILVPLRGARQEHVVRRSLHVRETKEGFPVVATSSPLALSHEFGEGGGVQLAFGDHLPAPDRVSSLAPLIELAPGGCSPEHLEIGGRFGAKCFGDVYVDAYGSRAFVRALFEGLRLEER